MQAAVKSIREELRERLAAFAAQGKLLEAQRLERARKYDIEMIEEVGYCPGIENYSRPPDGRTAGRDAVHADRLFPEGLCCSSTSRT